MIHDTLSSQLLTHCYQPLPTQHSDTPATRIAVIISFWAAAPKGTMTYRTTTYIFFCHLHPSEALPTTPNYFPAHTKAIPAPSEAYLAPSEAIRASSKAYPDSTDSLPALWQPLAALSEAFQGHLPPESVNWRIRSSG